VKEPAEFWTTMKVDSRPAIRLTITIPVVLDQPDAQYAAVTTLTSVYAQAGAAAATESLATIGGRVLRGPVATAVPVARAAVRLRHAAPSALPGPDKRAVTDADGRFTFAGIPAGGYELLVIAGSDFTAQTIDVPSPGGQYDVRLP
jgi:hypothetical protein